jgi:erythronate-4-phosphate dehydrogenase
MTELATPHIAGYSKDGKATGTQMSVQAISNFFNLELNNWQPSGVEPPANPVIKIDGAGLSEQEILSKAILHTYDIRNDDQRLRADTSNFEQQRGDYPVRREFPAYTVKTENVDEKTLEKLRQLGFKSPYRIPI